MNFKTISLICLSALSIISFNTLDKFIATDSITDDYYTSVKKGVRNKR